LLFFTMCAKIVGADFWELFSFPLNPAFS